MPNLINPLYTYLQQNPVPNLESRRDRFNAEYLLIDIPEIGAHISVYMDLKEGRNEQKPIFHFTLLRGNRNIHIYFDENHRELSATEEDLTDNTFKPLNDNSPEEEQLIYELYETHGLPIIQNILLAHKQEITQRQFEFRRSLERYNHKVFASNDTEAINGLAKVAEQRGLDLKTVSYRKKFVNDILNFLGKARQLLNVVKQSNIETISSAAEQTLPATQVAEEKSQSSKKKKKKKKKASSQTEKVAELSVKNKSKLRERFNQAYSAYKSLLNQFEEISIQDLKVKILAFNDMHSALSDLFLEANDISSYASYFQDEPLILLKADIEFNMWYEDYFNSGVQLLEEVLKSPQHLVLHGDSLKKYASYVDFSLLEDLLRNSSNESFAYLVENNEEVNLNTYLVTTSDPKQPRATLICQAFMNQNIAAFTALLTKGASCMCLYHDLPLAHELFKLPLNNPYRVEFMRHYTPVLSGSPMFYRKLESAMDRYLQTASLSKEQTVEIEEYKYKYARNRGGSQEKLGKSLTDEMATVLSHTDNNFGQRFKSSDRVSTLTLQLSELNAEFTRLLKKRHLLERHKRVADKLLRDSNQMLEKYGKQVSESMTTEIIEAEMEKAIAYTQAMIDFANLNIKTKRSRYEEKDLHEAISKIKQYEKDGIGSSSIGSSMRQESSSRQESSEMQELANILKFMGQGFTNDPNQQVMFDQAVDSMMSQAGSGDYRRGDNPQHLNLFAPPTHEEEKEMEEFMRRLGRSGGS